MAERLESSDNDAERTAMWSRLLNPVGMAARRSAGLLQTSTRRGPRCSPQRGAASTFRGVFASADSYDRFMGRYSVPLARSFAGFAGVQRGKRMLDVGCGTGVLTAELVGRLGAAAVCAVDPSEPFVAATRTRHPDVDVRMGRAEQLPFDDHSFDGALAQLVVHFMEQPVTGLGEMTRVTGPGGVVAACVWDFAGGHSPLATFWEAARELEPAIDDESERPGAGDGQLVELLEAAGLVEVEQGILPIEVEHPSFDEWWQPFTLGIGPAGTYLRGLDEEHQGELRERSRRRLPTEPFVVSARAWAARGRA
jgi:SAM-dependent methyltransferase